MRLESLNLNPNDDEFKQEHSTLMEMGNDKIESIYDKLTKTYLDTPTSFIRTIIN